VVKGLILPNVPAPPKSLVDAVCRSPLDRTQYFGEAVGVSSRILHRGDNHVNMVRHHDQAVNPNSPLVVVKSMSDDQTSNGFRQCPPLVCGKCDEEAFAPSLNMGEISQVFPFCWLGQ
jgi:hypothetical protein